MVKEKDGWRKQEPRELKRLWDAHHKMSQAEFAATYGLGTQGNISHYFAGRRPLTLDVARAVADHLGCRIEDFSPRLAKELKRQSSLMEWPFPRIDPARWWRLTPGQKLRIEGMVEGEIVDIEEVSYKSNDV